MSYCSCDERPGDACAVHDADDADLHAICDVCCREGGAERSRDDVVAELAALNPTAVTRYRDGWQSVEHDMGDHQLCPTHDVKPGDFWPVGEVA